MIRTLEQRCEELQLKVDTLREDSRSRSSRHERRTWSVPSIVDASDSSRVHSEGNCEVAANSQGQLVLIETRKDSEIKELKCTLFNMKQQMSREQRKRGDVEAELKAVLEENSEFEEQIKQLEERQKQIGTLENQLEEMELKSGTICKYCRDKISEGCLPDVIAIEPDDLEEIVHGQLHRLKNGGSAYGSKESLNNMGLETMEDEFFMIPNRDITCVDSLVTPSRETAPDEEEDDLNAGKSILGELEEQYMRLVNKYEALVEKKASREGRDIGVQKNLDSAKDQKRPTSIPIPPDGAGATQTPEVATQVDIPMQPVVMRRKKKKHLDISSPRDPTDGHFDKAPPEYKQLFQEIFETLRRSVVIDDEDADVLCNPKTF